MDRIEPTQADRDIAAIVVYDYELGKRDGYSDAVQRIDMLTGGDGEYYASTIPGRGCETPAAMIDRIVARFSTPAPDAEPVAWLYESKRDGQATRASTFRWLDLNHNGEWTTDFANWTETPLYAAPPAAVTVTDEQIDEIAREVREARSGYSIKLTRLVDDEATYTLNYRGFISTHESHGEASEELDRLATMSVRNAVRTILTAAMGG